MVWWKVWILGTVHLRRQYMGLHEDVETERSQSNGSRQFEAMWSVAQVDRRFLTSPRHKLRWSLLKPLVKRRRKDPTLSSYLFLNFTKVYAACPLPHVFYVHFCVIKGHQFYTFFLYEGELNEKTRIIYCSTAHRLTSTSIMVSAGVIVMCEMIIYCGTFVTL